MIESIRLRSSRMFHGLLLLGSALTACGGYDAPMVAVPAGPFMMGCNQALDTACEGDELPYHEVTLSAFEIDVTEVSQAAFGECVADGDCPPPSSDFDPDARADLAVAWVTWEQASAFCAWAERRLPSEAEWEKAARGADGRTYPWGEAPPDCALANVMGCGDAVAAVDAHPDGASPYGALAMAGNLMEWVNDFYDAAYYEVSPAQDPPGPVEANFRGKRGGSYMGDAQTVRVANRVTGFPVALPNLGFRCAR